MLDRSSYTNAYPPRLAIITTTFTSAKAQKPMLEINTTSVEKTHLASYRSQRMRPSIPRTHLQKISRWADGEDQQCLFWLSGMAGTGKSTIAHTVASAYFEQGRLAASFFFSRGGGDAGKARKFVTTIAVQLAVHVPPVQRHICDVIERSMTASLSLTDQWRQLVLGPLSKLDDNGTYPSYVIVIDALDECEGENYVQTIIQLLAEARSLKKVRLRVLVTSRPEVPIRYGFCQIPDGEHRDFILHDIEVAIVDHDISIFLDYELRRIGRERTLGAGWPGESVISFLVQKASGLFIWAATACRFIREGRRFVLRRLDMILQGDKLVTTPENHLNEIYLTVLESSIHQSYTEQEKEDLYDTLREILGSIVSLSSPLSTDSLATLLYIPKQDIDQTLEDLHAILDIPEDQSRLLRLHHPSFRDFILDKDRCSNPNFRVDEKQAHRTLADTCIRLMLNSLKQDICGQKAPGTLVADVKSSRIEQCLPPELKYACLYWIQHLQKSRAPLCDSDDKVYLFLKDYLLHWLEALSWIGKTSEGILEISSLEAQIPADKSPNIHTFIHDAKRFALYNRSVIEQAPLQLYCSALVFAPEKSIVQRRFKKCIPPWIQTKLKAQANWNAALQTLEGHSDWVRSVAFSPDGKLVVSGSNDKTVRLWDAVTGAAQQTLKGHSGSVISVAFSPDSKLIVSGSHDETVRLWDAVTGAAQQTLKGYLGSVRSVAFSPDGKLVVSGSNDKTVRLWDAVTGATQQTLKGHLSLVTSIAFSPDGKLVVSGSQDKTIKLWDAVTGVAQQTLKGHSTWVTSVAFSPDGKLVVSGSRDKTVRLWDAVTGAAQQTLKGHSGEVTSVAFSPDSKLIVSGSHDKTVRLWDAVTGATQQTLKGYLGSVTSVTFSPDSKLVVSGPYNKTVRLWDAVTGAARQTLEGDPSWVTSVAFSPDSKVVVSGLYNTTVALNTLSDSLEQLDGLSVRNDWVVEGSRNVLWLPPDYRATCVAVWNKIVVLGHSSGSISFLEFRTGLMLI